MVVPALLVLGVWLSAYHKHSIGDHLPILATLTLGALVLMVRSAFRMPDSTRFAQAIVVGVTLVTTWPLLVALYQHPDPSVLWVALIIYVFWAWDKFNSVRHMEFPLSALRAATQFTLPSICIGVLAARVAGYFAN